MGSAPQAYGQMVDEDIHAIIAYISLGE